MASVVDEKLRLYIADTGPGIHKHQLATIFEPFERLDREREEIEGTGIGLTIAKQLIELIDGQIGVTSSLGEGSTFFIELPVTHAEPVRHTKVVELPGADEQSRKELVLPSATQNHDQEVVLYVEDNKINRTLMEHIFAERSDIELVMAETARKGIALALSVEPILIMMDIRLPDGTGYDALAKLQANEKTADIPVVAVSANVTEHDILQGREAGFIEYLEKPVDIKRLMKLIDLYMDDREALPN
ncbi:hypothetical protein BOW51_10095 [Solemya velesiana gill symbiont]|uniref:histidine kinase n=2 Tax=Solemya velesiana gill symbiont TaxID=1918948 RepID=A0A1T2KSI7_9GAMM|nr:hypothetical protein BOW51_10095 [Solemya velesiana gill symbiont]